MHPRHKQKVYWVSGIAGALFGLIFFLNIVPYFHSKFTKPDKQDIWSYVEKQANRKKLDPHFIYAIIFAESSFDPAAEASNGYARGLMQMSEAAWETSGEGSWRNAYNWKDNIEAGTAYLAHLRDRLESEGQFSYPLLAASYRYGPGKVKQAGYSLSGVPAPHNDTYKALFAGNNDPVPPPG